MDCGRDVWSVDVTFFSISLQELYLKWFRCEVRYAKRRCYDLCDWISHVPHCLPLVSPPSCADFTKKIRIMIWFESKRTETKIIKINDVFRIVFWGFICFAVKLYVYDRAVENIFYLFISLRAFQQRNTRSPGNLLFHDGASDWWADESNREQNCWRHHQERVCNGFGQFNIFALRILPSTRHNKILSQNYCYWIKKQFNNRQTRKKAAHVDYLSEESQLPTTNKNKRFSLLFLLVWMWTTETSRGKIKKEITKTKQNRFTAPNHARWLSVVCGLSLFRFSLLFFV